LIYLYHKNITLAANFQSAGHSLTFPSWEHLKNSEQIGVMPQLWEQVVDPTGILPKLYKADR
jgi:hypothetical protein